MNATVTEIDLRDYPLPFYDGDLEANQGQPENAKKLIQLMKRSDLIIIASPNYNGSISGVLKNMIDWTSRSEEGKLSYVAFKNKKFLLLSTSPGKKRRS